MLLESTARAIRRALRAPPIDPVLAMPWTCSRCGKTYTRHRAHAQAHVRDDSCSVRAVRNRSPSPPPPARPRRPFGLQRRLEWIDTLRRAIVSPETLQPPPQLPTRPHPGCTSCELTTQDQACERCFHYQWIAAAREQESWDRLTYSVQSSDSTHIGRRRRSKWTAPEGDWVDPR